MQFTWSLCPPSSTNFPDGCGRVAGSAADALITTRHAIIAAQKHLNVMAVIVSDRRLLTWASTHYLRRLTPMYVTNPGRFLAMIEIDDSHADH